MKLFFVAILFYIISCNTQNSNNRMSYNLPTIGMDFSEFAIDFPQVVKGETNGNKQYNIDDTVNNLAGTWAYTFVDNKLEWFMFNSYSDEISEQNFNAYMSETQNIIENLKIQFGEPKEFIFENKNFKDPFKEMHWGYDVITALWTTKEMDFEVKFKFMGSRGEYKFLFSMEFQKHGYEYF